MSDNIRDFDILNLCASYPSKTPPRFQTGFHSTPGRFVDDSIEDHGQAKNEENKSSPPFRRGSSQGVANPSVIPLDAETKLAVQTMISEDLKRHRYEIDFNDVIARGQYGSVYKVRSEKTDRVMTAKIFSMMLRCVEKNGRVENGPLVRSFRRERSMVSLIGTHANLVSFVDCFVERNEVPKNGGEDGEQKSIQVPNYYFIMEYASQGTLTQLVRRTQPDFLTESEVKFLARDLVRAVSHLHKLAIYHLDIKSDNMLLFEGGSGPLNLTLKLTDFGLAHTEPTMIDAVGTYVSMAPELLRNRWLFRNNLEEFREVYYCARADAWSVGATIFFALHGRFPSEYFEYSQLTKIFRIHGLADRNKKFLHGQMSLLMGKPRAQLTRQCVHLLKRLLEVDPNQRARIDDTILNEWLYSETELSILTSLCDCFR